jgi:hypothetical protein
MNVTSQQAWVVYNFETRRKYIPVGLTVASMLPTVSVVAHGCAVNEPKDGKSYTTQTY